jgi:hypothetical protein
MLTLQTSSTPTDSADLAPECFGILGLTRPAPNRVCGQSTGLPAHLSPSALDVTVDRRAHGSVVRLRDQAIRQIWAKGGRRSENGNPLPTISLGIVTHC